MGAVRCDEHGARISEAAIPGWLSRADGEARNMRRRLIIISVLSATPQLGFAGDRCLEYGAVSLSGTLVRQTYPGPPDYESISKGDEPRIIRVLLLDQPICVVDSDPRYPREYYEREIQLALRADQFERYRNLLGKKVIVSGRLLPGGARHDKRLLIAAREIRRTSVRP
jgi:Domain of unknown function (DUF4431)